MGRRRFEMFQYRQVLVRLREGDSERVIARDGLMGREKVAAFRALSRAQGWLELDVPLPEESAIAAAVGQARRARTTISSAIPWEPLIAAWLERGVQVRPCTRRYAATMASLAATPRCTG